MSNNHSHLVSSAAFTTVTPLLVLGLWICVNLISVTEKFSPTGLLPVCVRSFCHDNGCDFSLFSDNFVLIADLIPVYEGRLWKLVIAAWSGLIKSNCGKYNGCLQCSVRLGLTGNPTTAFIICFRVRRLRPFWGWLPLTTMRVIDSASVPLFLVFCLYHSSSCWRQEW